MELQQAAGPLPIDQIFHNSRELFIEALGNKIYIILSYIRSFLDKKGDPSRRRGLVGERLQYKKDCRIQARQQYKKDGNTRRTAIQERQQYKEDCNTRKIAEYKKDGSTRKTATR